MTLFDRIFIQPRRNPARAKADQQNDDGQDQGRGVAAFAHFGVGRAQLEENRQRERGRRAQERGGQPVSLSGRNKH